MTYINLDDAIAAVASVPIKYDNGEPIPALCVQIDAVTALRALPTVSDGWEDIATAKLDAWRFNVMLECQGGNGECVVGGAELNMNDLLAILDFVSDRSPLPAPPNPMHYGPMHDLQIDPNYTVKTQTVKSFDDEYNASPTWPTPTID